MEGKLTGAVNYSLPLHFRSRAVIVPAWEFFMSRPSHIVKAKMYPALHLWNTNLQQAPMISIVDDDLSIRQAVMCLIRSLGYDAVTFSSAEEFLESGKVETTSCVISDMHMPGLSGAELQDHLIGRGHRVPIIFVTADSEENLRGRVLKAGAIGYLSKPFNVEHLILCLDVALASSNSRSCER